jgi:hypothetical protein
MPHKDPEARRAYERAYRKKNRERLRVYHKEWEEKNADHVAEYKRSYRETHREQKAANARKHYDKHREAKAVRMKAYRQRVSERDLEAQRRKRTWYRKTLKIIREAQGCADCGKRKGWLEHHHVDPKTKLVSIGNMAHHGLEAWFDEIAKCIVLCRPCHKKRHFAMEGKPCD